MSSAACKQTEKSIPVSNSPLTTEEKLEDFEHAYNIIKRKIITFLEVNKRLHGIDWLAKKDEYVERIKNTDTIRNL